MTFAPGIRRRSAHGFTLVETLIVVGLIGVISAIAVPMFSNTIKNFRITGDVRSVANATALAKMRAASTFGRTRLFVDLAGRTHHMESWDKVTSTWIIETGLTSLSTGVSFGFGAVAAAPPSTQGAIGQAIICSDNAGVDIANTACITFNSRGVPIDSTLAPTSLDALYLTDGLSVYAVTIAATGMLRTWNTPPVAAPNWVLQ